MDRSVEGQGFLQENKWRKFLRHLVVIFGLVLGYFLADWFADTSHPFYSALSVGFSVGCILNILVEVPYFQAQNTRSLKNMSEYNDEIERMSIFIDDNSVWDSSIFDIAFYFLMLGFFIFVVFPDAYQEAIGEGSIIGAYAIGLNLAPIVMKMGHLIKEYH